jgi:glycosyltransferase involved in cell wall biosynthesis
MKTISLVAPCYNEAENIEKYYEEVIRVLGDIPYNLQLVFVNDGSSDRTLNILLALSEKDKRVKIVDLSRNFGKEIALTAGLDYADGDAVVPIDVDLQDPPYVVKELIAKWEEGYDVVYATRAERAGETFMKKFTAKVFYKVIASVNKIKVPRNTGDFRLMDRRVVEELKKFKEQHRFMKGLFAWVGFKQTQVFYDRESRNAGFTKFNYWKLINLAVEGITSFTVAPLRVATFLGAIISIFAFLFALYTIIATVTMGNDVPGYSSLMVVILFLGGVQLLTIGIIGEYIGRIFNETKNRPLYIVNAIH